MGYRIQPIKTKLKRSSFAIFFRVYISNPYYLSN
jgi:hypothetical protein